MRVAICELIIYVNVSHAEKELPTTFQKIKIKRFFKDIHNVLSGSKKDYV